MPLCCDPPSLLVLSFIALGLNRLFTAPQPASPPSCQAVEGIYNSPPAPSISSIQHSRLYSSTLKNPTRGYRQDLKKCMVSPHRVFFVSPHSPSCLCIPFQKTVSRTGLYSGYVEYDMGNAEMNTSSSNGSEANPTPSSGSSSCSHAGWVEDPKVFIIRPGHGTGRSFSLGRESPERGLARTGG